VRTVWDREAASSNLAAPTNRGSRDRSFPRMSGANSTAGQTKHPEEIFFLITPK